MMNQCKTLGELKATGYTSKSIKEELRENLLKKLADNDVIFDGIIGYDHTVLPQIKRAILSGHNINLLGLRGQAKTRIARKMIDLLDEWIPIIEGSEILDDPLAPLSSFGKKIIEEKGDDTPISWVHRSDRFAEKLATPDVSVADLIGDIDPIKAATLKLSYDDPKVIHFGMIPRSNRCIFVINELPDLQARIQVSLFNILQEGDIQIRGFKLRLPLDIQFIFTANPEDYTNRGSIVTPLKDRIGSQILTHYPLTMETAQFITQQEVSISQSQKDTVFVPELAKRLIEQISFQARESDFIDAKSGVSARLSISAYENLVATAELRALVNKLSYTSVRVSDFMGIIPSITGKVELVYEGEQEGSESVAHHLIGEAIKSLFLEHFPKIPKLRKENDHSPYDDVNIWFMNQNEFELEDTLAEDIFRRQLERIDPLVELVDNYMADLSEEDRFFAFEMTLWALVELQQLTKDRYAGGFQFKDILGGYLSGLS